MLGRLAVRIIIGLPLVIMSLAVLSVFWLLLTDFWPEPSARTIAVALPFLFRTATFAVVTTTGQFALGLLAALCVLWLARSRWSQLGLITIFLLPYAIPASTIGLAFRFAFGPDSVWAAWASPLFGVEPQFWLYDNALKASMVACIWQFFPFSFLLFYLALKTTPAATLRAAQLDGAGFTRITLNVVLGRIAPILAAVFVLRLTFMLVKFDTPFVFTETIATLDDVATVELARAVIGSPSPELPVIAWALQLTAFLVAITYVGLRRRAPI
jgi:ABC-type sugar transport system permease subunit